MTSTLALPPPKFPEDSASPAEVRNYFTEILIHDYQVSEDEATHVVRAWRYGTGAAIQRFDAEAYSGTFGAEIGTILYQHHSTPLFNFRIPKNPQKKPVNPDPMFMYQAWPVMLSDIAAVCSMFSLGGYLANGSPDQGLYIATSVTHVASQGVFLLPELMVQEGVKRSIALIFLVPIRKLAWGWLFSASSTHTY